MSCPQSVLFWLEPHFELSRPFVMQTWFKWFERMATELIEASPETEVRFAGLDSFLYKPSQNAFRDKLITFTQGELRGNWTLAGDVFELLENDEIPQAHIDALASIIRKKLGGFEPAYLIAHNQHPWLRRAFPQATFINIELGWLSRAPFPQVWQLDPVGAGKGRVLAEHADKILDRLVFDETADRFLKDISIKVRQRLASPETEAFIAPLRQRFQRLALLPLGIFARLDGRTPIFAYLDQYLETQSAETGFLLTQHPMEKVMNPAQIEYLTAKYPYLLDATALNSQKALPLVDVVVGDFSTVATQALFHQVEIVSIQRRLGFPIPGGGILGNPLANLFDNAREETRRKSLLWLLTHYAVPATKLFEGKWLHQFLSRARDAAQSEEPWQAYPHEVMGAEEWHRVSLDDVAQTPAGAAHATHDSYSVFFDKVAQILDTVDSDAVEKSSSPSAAALPLVDEERYQSARRLIDEGNLAGAGEILIALAAEGTPLWSAYSDLAALALQGDDVQAATDLLEVAVIKEPEPGKAVLNLASLQAAEGRHEEALSTLSRYLRKRPDDPDGLNVLRDILGIASALSPVAWARLLADLRYNDAVLSARLQKREVAIEELRGIKSDFEAMKQSLG